MRVFWSNKTGGVTLTINWADSGNDFDLFVYDQQGNEVTRLTAMESQRIGYTTPPDFSKGVTTSSRN
jgi:hypothetical protein